MAAVLVGVMRLLGCPFDSASRLACESCLLAVGCVYCRRSLSIVFLGGAWCSELSLCNTLQSNHAHAVLYSRLDLMGIRYWSMACPSSNLATKRPVLMIMN